VDEFAERLSMPTLQGARRKSKGDRRADHLLLAWNAEDLFRFLASFR
jgi:hypothetical protein